MDDITSHFRDQNVQKAVKNLLVYSLTILAVPMGSMFLLKFYFFETLLGWTPSDSMMYSAVIAVILVHIVLIAWIATACADDKPKKADKAEKDD